MTLLHVVEVPKEVTKSYVYTEEQAQIDMTDTQYKSHKDFTGKQIALLNARASDMPPQNGKQRHKGRYCSGKITKDGLVGLELHDNVLSPERAVTVEDINRDMKKYCEGTSCIAGVYVEATKERLSIYQAMMKKMITNGTALQLLEAQAATGYVIDPISNQNLTVNQAVEMGVVGPEFKKKLLSAEQAVTGYPDPYSGRLMSLLQAMKMGLILKGHGIRLLKAQIATGGIIDLEANHHLPVEVAYKHDLFDEEMNRILTDPSSDTKGFFDPNTGKNLTYSQLMEQCKIDSETGLSFLLLKEKKQEIKTSLTVQDGRNIHPRQGILLCKGVSHMQRKAVNKNTFKK